jgi:hypothetical protein
VNKFGITESKPETDKALGRFSIGSEFFLFFIVLPFTPRDNADKNENRNETSDHKNNKPHNHSLAGSEFLLFFLFLPLLFTPRSNTANDYYRNNTSNHKNSNPHNYSIIYPFFAEKARGIQKSGDKELTA